MSGAYVIAARRSIVAPRGGALAGLEPHEMAAPVLRACLDDAGLPGEAVDEVILSNALGAGGNPARLAALAAGLPETVAGLSLDRQCCGGLDALGLARAMILAGDAEAVLAGGAESYSRRPERRRDGQAYDQPPFTPWPDRDPGMAQAAEALACQLGITRAEQDAWAVASHAAALAARDRSAREIVPLPGVAARHDPFARRLGAALAARAPVLTGSISHANTAPAADGAAFCLVVSEALHRRLARPALALLGHVAKGGDPMLPGLAPVAAVAALNRRLGLAASDYAQAEIMEAYAVQAIACQRGAGIARARVNPGGGALARGHPIGASGAVLAVRLYHDLLRHAAPARGLAAIAAAGGIGSALALETAR